MVYYHTSGNLKILRNILTDYGATSEVSPYEYMETYIEKYPEDIDEAKLSWIVETFLGIQKHRQFLKSIASHLSEELTEEDQDYFVIVFHAIIFQIGSKDMQYLYKCLFNTSKPLLNTFTNFLGNNETLTFISHLAQSHYDTNYITNNIIGPLFTWQPYISEMGHNYAEYVQKIENRKVKPPTIPIQPNVLNRKTKESSSPTRASFPATPPNSMRIKSNKKMLTKTSIDQKLQQLHEKNKQKAALLLNSVRNKDFHFAQDKSDNYFRRLSTLREEIENQFMKPLPKPRLKFVLKHSPTPVKETTATLKRLNKRVQQAEHDEIQWLADLMNSCKTTGKVEQLLEYDRKETEKERIYDIEKKHLEGQISHEVALIAKKKVQEDNKKKYDEYLKEKESWNEEIERWKQMEFKKHRQSIEKLSMAELNLLQARNSIAAKNKERAENMKKEKEIIYQKVMKSKREELEKRVSMIKEIRLLAMIAKKSKLPKIIDLTETSGLGLLCEMSMAELQERLGAMKMSLKDELEQKKRLIREENIAAKQDLEQAKISINAYMTDQANLRKYNNKSHVTLDSASSKDINNLKKILEEKRKLRMQLTT